MDDWVLLFQVREGVAARMLLVAIGGGDSEQARARASRELADRLRANPRFTNIANGGFELSDKDRFAALYDYRYLIGPKGPCVDALSAGGLCVRPCECGSTS